MCKSKSCWVFELERLVRHFEEGQARAVIHAVEGVQHARGAALHGLLDQHGLNERQSQEVSGKYTERKFTVGSFTKAGFKPPAFYIWVAMIVETILSIALIFGIYTTIGGSIAAVHLAFAAGAVYRVSGGRWFWNLGRYECACEYCAFWVICCIVVAMHGY
jgi:uncharacterized membrane protein YphA (DoxX/SURF4 family)